METVNKSIIRADKNFSPTEDITQILKCETKENFEELLNSETYQKWMLISSETNLKYLKIQNNFDQVQFENANLRKQIISQKQTIDILKTSNITLEKQIDNTAKQLRAKSIIVEKYKDHLNMLAKAMERIDNTRTNIELWISTERKTQMDIIKRLTEEKKNFETMKNNLSTELILLHNSCSDLAVQLSEEKKRNLSIIVQMESMNKEVTKLSAINRSYGLEINQITNNSITKKKEIFELNKQIDDMILKERELLTEIEMINENKQQIELNMKLKIDHAEGENKKLNNKVSTFEQMIKDLDEQLKNAEKNFTVSLEKVKNELSAEKEEMQSEIDFLKNEMGDFENVKLELHKLKECQTIKEEENRKLKYREKLYKERIQQLNTAQRNRSKYITESPDLNEMTDIIADVPVSPDTHILATNIRRMPKSPHEVLNKRIPGNNDMSDCNHVDSFMDVLPDGIMQSLNRNGTKHYKNKSDSSDSPDEYLKRKKSGQRK